MGMIDKDGNYIWQRDPYYFGQAFWGWLAPILGRDPGDGPTITYANERWYQRPWIALALWAHETHNWHEWHLTPRKASYTSIHFCKWPGCWLLYRICEIALAGRFCWP